jgi:hypothetical protein
VATWSWTSWPNVATLARMEATKPRNVKPWSTRKVLGVVTAIAGAALLGLCWWWQCVVDPWAAQAHYPQQQTGSEYRNYSVPGAFGDSFAPIVGIFTSLTLGAAIASVFMQRAELAALHDEMEEAREQWTKHKRAEIAGEVLVSALDALDGLLYVADPKFRGPADNTDPRKGVAEQLTARWPLISESLRRLHRARGLASVYISRPEVTDLLAEVERLVSGIRAAQETWVQVGVFGTHDGNVISGGAVGSEVQEKIQSLEVEVKEVVGPLARMDGWRQS